MAATVVKYSRTLRKNRLTMSNMPNINRTRLTVRIPLALRAKLRTMCRSTGQAENDILAAALGKYLKKAETAPEDLEWIEEERKRNDRMRRRSAQEGK